MIKSHQKNEELEASPPGDDDTVFNPEDQKEERRVTLKRIVISMIVFSVILSVLTSCLVIIGSQEEDFNNFSDLTEFTFKKTKNKTEQLSSPAAQLSPEARNYVAYIPVPINDDDEEEEEYEDDEYYDEYDEYYDEEEEDYEEEEKRPSKKRKKGRHKGNVNSKNSKRRYHPSKSSTEDKERVPFLVPLMMVPENQVGVQKEFSFSKDSNERLQNDDDDGGDGGVFTSILNLNNNRRPPLRRNSGPSRLPRPRPNGIPSRPIHNIPGPPYRGPSPRNPNLPLDKTIIHPSIHRPRFRRPPRNFRARPYTTPSTSTTTVMSTTTEVTTPETVTKSKPNIIVVQQQPSYNPYRPPYSYNPYPPVYQPYPYPPPTPPPSTTTTTTTTTTTITTTTTKTKKKRKKRKKKPVESLYSTNLSDDQITSLSQPQLTIVDNKVVPIMNKQQQSILSKRFGLQARRFNQPYKVRGRRRPVKGVGGSQSSPRGPYRDRRPQDRPGRRFDMPNIFTQSGFPYDQYEEERPIINRPPPRHPGVRVPGVRVPANAGSIEDIISPKPVLPHNNQIPGTNNYRPPVKNVVHVQYDDPPRRPDTKYKKPAHRPHLHDDRPHYQEPSYRPPPHEEPSYKPPPHEEPSYKPPSYNEPSYRPPPHKEPSYKPPPHKEPSYRPPPYDEPSYDPPPQDEPSYRPPSYDEPPYRPPPSNNYDYRPPPSNDYDVPPRPQSSNEYDYRPSNEYSEPPPRPSSNYEDESHYRPPPSYQEESYYEPPDNEYGPVVEDYKPPSKYRPRPPSYETGQGDRYQPKPEDVVPPAYNQDYYLTPDPQNDVYPGPDIYDGGSVHGPGTGDRKSQLGYQPPPTLGPPTRIPQVSSGYRPRPNDISSPVNVDKYDSQRYHPDGPDYSSGTLINSYKGSTPFKVGLDLYPIEGVSPLGGFGKQDIYSSVIPGGSGGDDNKHEILLHLNLFSKKPAKLGGRSGGGSRAEDIDLDSPSVYRRQEVAMSKTEKKEPVHLELPSLSETIKGHPIFGDLNPFDILQHLLKQSLKKEEDSKKSKPPYEETIKSRTTNLDNHRGRENNVTEIRNINRRVDSDHDLKLSDQDDLDMEEAKSDPEYYYYYYYDYMDSGIDISHELSTFEPLPTPLPIKESEHSKDLNKAKNNQSDVKNNKE